MGLKRVPLGILLCRAIAVAAGAASLASCAPARKPAPVAEKLTIAYSTAFNSTLMYLAFAKGYFQEEGLDAVPQPYDFGKPALQALIEGRADLATAGDTPIAFAVMNGAPIRILAEIQTSNRNEGIVARTDRGIAGASDLRGKRLGITPGTTSEFFAHVFLVGNKIEAGSVALVRLLPDEMGAALAEGKVDAVSTWNPGLARIARALGDRGRTFYGEKLYTETFCLVAGAEYAKAHPQAVRKVLRALAKAEDLVRDRNEEARAAVADFLHADRAILDDIWEVFTFRLSLDQGLLVDLEDQTRWMLSSGLAPRAAMPNYLDYIDLDGLQAVRKDAVRIIR